MPKVEEERQLSIHNETHHTSPRVKQAVLSSTFATGLFLSAPMISEAALGDQPLTEGMSHPDVKQLQEVLKAKGYFQYHTATGYYGSITSNAVSAFQRAEGLPTNGQATRETLDHLLANAAKAAQDKVATVTDGILRQGTTSSQVLNLQEQLKRAGYFHQEPTGYYGRVTTEAVRSFQRAQGLTVDGIAGPKTLTALTNTTAVSMSATSTNQAKSEQQSNPTLRNGARGEAVSRLQQRLLDLGYYTGAVDGIFGQGTERAVRLMQNQHRLVVDGIVGAKTWSTLASASAMTSAGSGEKQPQPADPTPAPPPADQALGSSSLLKIGSQGENVRVMQAQLKTIGLFNQEPTGYYGTVTEQAVRAFQRQQGLAVDGVAGKQTLDRLSKLAGTPVANTGTGFSVMNIVADASELLGIPYVWGGTNTEGFDCSGFIHYVFAKNNIQLARTVAGMWEAGTVVAAPAVGDIVFFETYTAGPSHAGIYIGNDQFVHSGTSTGVAVANLKTKYWSERYLGAKRFY